MKARLGMCMLTWSGRVGNKVYAFYAKRGMNVVREYVKPAHGPQQDMMGSVSQNLSRIELSEGYKNDLRRYVVLYNYQRRTKFIPNWYTAYIKLMFAMRRLMPEVDLATLTKEEIYARNLPCISVQRAVDAFLLPCVPNWLALTQEM